MLTMCSNVFEPVSAAGYRNIRPHAITSDTETVDAMDQVTR